MTIAADTFFDSGTWVLARNLTLLLGVVFWLATAFWVYKDARRRINDPWLVGMAAVLGLVPPFVGPIIYLFLRPPESIEERRDRDLDNRALEERLAGSDLRCPVCRAHVQPSFLVCPVCTTRLKQACDSCGAPRAAYCWTRIRCTRPWRYADHATTVHCEARGNC